MQNLFQIISSIFISISKDLLFYDDNLKVKKLESISVLAAVRTTPMESNYQLSMENDNDTKKSSASKTSSHIFQKVRRS